MANRYAGCRSAEQASLVERYAFFTGDVFAHGTYNHAALSVTSHYLLAQEYPQYSWRWGALSSSELRSHVKELWRRRVQGLYAQGYYEQSSPVYVPASLIGALNLFDFASDPELRSLADKEAIALLALSRATTFNGAMVPPLMRAHQAQRTGGAPYRYTTEPSQTQLASWLYFGVPDASAVDLERTDQPLFVTHLALSSWRPPSALAEMLNDVSRPYEVKVQIPRFSFWGARTKPEIIGGAYVDQDFAIGGGNQYIDTAGYNEANQLFGIMYRTDDKSGLVDCYHPYWLSNKGKYAWSYDRSSPFQQYHRSGNRGVLVFDIPERDPFQHGLGNRFFATRSKHANSLFQSVLCRFPASVDEVVQTPSAIFLREGRVFVALRALSGRFEDVALDPTKASDFRSVEIKLGKTAVYFKVEAGEPDAFSEFIARAQADHATFDAGAAEYEVERALIRVRFAHKVESDGWLASFPEVTKNGNVEVAAQSALVVDSPFLKFGDDVLSILKGEREVLRLSP